MLESPSHFYQKMNTIDKTKDSFKADENFMDYSNQNKSSVNRKAIYN